MLGWPADSPATSSLGDMTTQPGLARNVGLFDAIVIGLGSMIGAGVFAAFAPAAQAAGGALLAGLVVAGVVAFCNATSSAQLAAVYPASGGTYVYGRAELGHWWGFIAGWCFVVGKTASCAAMALTFASYAVPWPAWRRPVAIAAVIVLASVNYRGITRTARLSRILLAIVLAVLAMAVTVGLTSTSIPALGGVTGTGLFGVLQAAGLLFFAFAGYARIATLGEEVRDPERTIPRAIPIALAVTFVVYLLVAFMLLVALGPRDLAGSHAPIADAMAAVGARWAVPVVRVGAAVATLGALLSLIAGVGRTGLAMARERDLPGWLSGVHPRYQVPHHAEIALAALVCVLVAVFDLRGVIGFSSFGVLVYYGIANASAFKQTRGRRYPRALQVLGMGLCTTLAFTLPWQSVLAGVTVVGMGLAGRAVVLIRRRSGQPDLA